MKSNVRLFALCISLLLSPQIWADLVTPNDRVTSRLVVRADSNSSSTIRGYLYPGDTAQLDGSVPYWYEIKLDDGTPGFVSKGYASVVTTLSSSQVLRLGSWNIKKLGHGSSKDYPVTAQIIEDNFDILAVVEVMQKGGAHGGYDDLIAQLGPNWAGMVTSEPRPNISNVGSAEFYAIVYRTARVSPCTGWTALVYHVDNDGGPTGTGANVFSREPAFGCFVAGNFDFVLAAYHALWGGGDIDDISAEAMHLEEVFDSMEASQANEDDLFIAGDFNLVPSDLHNAINREIPTVGTGSTLNGSGERTSNLYDHLIVFDPNETTEQIGAAEVIDVRDAVVDDKTFFKTVSDHLPIVARFDTSGPDDD